MEQRDRDPLPELLVVEHLGALGGDVEGRILLSRRGRTCSGKDQISPTLHREKEVETRGDHQLCNLTIYVVASISLSKLNQTNKKSLTLKIRNILKIELRDCNQSKKTHYLEN